MNRLMTSTLVTDEERKAKLTPQQMREAVLCIEMFKMLYDSVVPQSWYVVGNRKVSAKEKNRIRFFSRAEKAAYACYSGSVVKLGESQISTQYRVSSVNRDSTGALERSDHIVYIGKGLWLKNGDFQCTCKESFRDENFPCYHVLSAAMFGIVTVLDANIEAAEKEAEAVSIFNIYSSFMDGTPLGVQK